MICNFDKIWYSKYNWGTKLIMICYYNFWWFKLSYRKRDATEKSIKIVKSDKSQITSCLSSFERGGAIKNNFIFINKFLDQCAILYNEYSSHCASILTRHLRVLALRRRQIGPPNASSEAGIYRRKKGDVITFFCQEKNKEKRGKRR